LAGEGGIGPALSDQGFQQSNNDQQLFDTISRGHKATAMIGWGEILSTEQIQQLVSFIRTLESTEVQPDTGAGPTPTPGAVSFTTDVAPIFKAKCVICHGTLGGWDGSNYEAVMTSGNNAPVVIPGDLHGSLLAQKLLGTQTFGDIMPPGGKLSDDEIQIILDWIELGAPEK
jgi:mono/diheme cytochrome c family protein